MKNSFILLALLSLALAGCTSFQLIDGRTRAFLQWKPGAASQYETIVKSKSGVEIISKENEASFDTSNGIKKILVNPANDPANENGGWRRPERFTLPVPDLQSLRMQAGISVLTFDNAEYKAGPNDWEFILKDDSDWMWQAKYVFDTTRNISRDTTISERNIKAIKFSAFDIGKTVLVLIPFVAIIVLDAIMLSNDQ